MFFPPPEGVAVTVGDGGRRGSQLRSIHFVVFVQKELIKVQLRAVAPTRAAAAGCPPICTSPRTICLKPLGPDTRFTRSMTGSMTEASRTATTH